MTCHKTIHLNDFERSTQTCHITLYRIPSFLLFLSANKPKSVVIKPVFSTHFLVAPSVHDVTSAFPSPSSPSHLPPHATPLIQIQQKSKNPHSLKKNVTF